MSSLRGGAIALLVLLSTATAAPAAASPGLVGRVLDDRGLPLPGVTVVVEGHGLKPVVATTDADGRYRLADLAAGRYRATFRLLSFVSVSRPAIDVAAGPDTVLNVVLPLSTSADVVVTGKRTFRNLADLASTDDLLGVADAATVGVVTAAQMEARPITRAGEVLEAVPGVVISQHSGEGKANQYYLRGFNLDHGTDLSATVAGIPANMPTHAHGQGYLDLNFLIPELVTGIQYRKGPYDAENGDFSAAGSVAVSYANVLERPIAKLELGELGFQRTFGAVSPKLGQGHLLVAGELFHNDGPWEVKDDYRRANGVLRYSVGDERSGFALTAMAYQGRWTSTDQVAQRAVDSGLIGRFGSLDPTDGGKTHRYTLSAEWQRSVADNVLKASAYVVDYDLNLYSNFTYFLDDPENGDQFEQEDRRLVTGVRASSQWLSRLGSIGVETTVGIEARNDNISSVGLYHTRARQRLETTRVDQVAQTSGSLYAKATLSLQPWLRANAGLRGDLHRFKVDANLPSNTGDETRGVLSPKLGLVFGPFARTEIYLNGGYGFHSNDARGSTITVDPSSGEPAERVNPLVRAKGAEIGVRTTALPHLQATAALWGLDLDSELLFVGDAGTTEPSRPSRRTGVELSLYYTPAPWLTLDADYAYSRGVFRDDDPAGDRIPGSIEGVASAGVSVEGLRGFFGSLRLRYFGPRSLIEDDSVRSASSATWNARVGYQIGKSVRIAVEGLNLFDAAASDVDYFYTSRLPGEPTEGVDDVHSHPLEPRAFRASISVSF